MSDVEHRQSSHQWKPEITRHFAGGSIVEQEGVGVEGHAESDGLRLAAVKTWNRAEQGTGVRRAAPMEPCREERRARRQPLRVYPGA